MKVAGTSIDMAVTWPLRRLHAWLEKVVATDSSQGIAVLLRSAMQKLDVIQQLGLGYLSLNQSSTTLSTGELQRLRMVRQLSSGLSGVVYVLDEPTAGLHEQDAAKVLDFMRALKKQDNSLIVVEHRESLIAASDHVLVLGPGEDWIKR